MSAEDPLPARLKEALAPVAAKPGPAELARLHRAVERTLGNSAGRPAGHAPGRHPAGPHASPLRCLPGPAGTSGSPPAQVVTLRPVGPAADTRQRRRLTPWAMVAIGGASLLLPAAAAASTSAIISHSARPPALQRIAPATRHPETQPGAHPAARSRVNPGPPTTAHQARVPQASPSAPVAPNARLVVPATPVSTPRACSGIGCMAVPSPVPPAGDPNQSGTVASPPAVLASPRTSVPTTIPTPAPTTVPANVPGDTGSCNVSGCTATSAGGTWSCTFTACTFIFPDGSAESCSFAGCTSTPPTTGFGRLDSAPSATAR